jgi:hypothetical protein
MENWRREAGGDRVALLHILDTFVDTPSEALEFDNIGGRLVL